MFKLYDYQTAISDEAVKKITSLGIVYLSMQVRTGKTFTALATAEKYGAKRVLFITKKKAISSIKSDYDTMQPSFNVCIINYESVHKIDFKPDFIIIDEAHSLGQYPKPSERTKKIKAIVGNLPIILMSGTPSPESYSQLYHQFWVSDNTPFPQFKSFYKWANAGYINITKKYVAGNNVNDYSKANKKMIDKACDFYFISFTQKDAGFHLEVDDNVLICNMKPEIYKLIDKLNKDEIYQMKSGGVITADTGVKKKNKAHQISSGTIIDDDGDGHILDMSKAVFIRDKFKGKKIAIFYKFKAEFSMLKKTFNNWTADPQEFQKSKDKVFLGQYQSAREGIRLDTADALIFLNLDYSYLSYEQGKNRLMSKDRKKNAPLYIILSDQGIDADIHETVLKKKDYTLSHYKRRFNVRR